MKPRQERIETIRRIIKSAKDDDSINKYPIKNWRGKPLYRKIVQIDSEYLMYRIENSRTEIQQLAYIRKNNLTKDFFHDPESPHVQEAQENILSDMIKSKGKELLEDLKIRKQEDACIITYDGYILNGNRRTAGLKMLGDRYIDCVVLPDDASPKDLYILEQQLQISEDFKEKYHWINELRNIYKGKEDSRFELSEKELAENLRLDTREVRVMLRKLELIDAFLRWKNIPKQYDYHKLDDAEEIFGQLEKAIKKYSKDILKRQSLQNAVFSLIENRPGKGRLYGYVMDLIRSFDQIYNKMQPQTEIPSTSNNRELKSGDSNLFNDLVDTTTVSDTPLFRKPEDSPDNSNNLIDIIADIKAETKERKDAEAAYDSVSIALRELQAVSIDNDTSKLGVIRNKLDQIISVSHRLLSELKSFEIQ